MLDEKGRNDSPFGAGRSNTAPYNKPRAITPPPPQHSADLDFLNGPGSVDRSR